MHRVDAYETMRRRTAEAGFKGKLGCHVFRATGITAYLEAGETLENAQAMAAHESPRTTKLYDRTGARSRSMKSSGSIFSSQSAACATDEEMRGLCTFVDRNLHECGA